MDLLLAPFPLLSTLLFAEVYTPWYPQIIEFSHAWRISLVPLASQGATEVLELSALVGCPFQRGA
jgi:hypothetical protein